MKASMKASKKARRGRVDKGRGESDIDVVRGLLTIDHGVQS